MVLGKGCWPVPQGHPQPEPSPPHPPRRSPAQPPSSQLCTARQGYSRSFRYTTSPQLLHPCPALGCPKRQVAKGRKIGRGTGTREWAPQLQGSVGSPKSSVFKNNKPRPPCCSRDTSSGEHTDTISRTPNSNKAPEASNEQYHHRPRLGYLPAEFFGNKNAPSRPRAHGADPQVRAQLRPAS